MAEFKVGDKVLIRSEWDLINEFGIKYRGLLNMNSDMIKFQLGHRGIIHRIEEYQDLSYLVITPGSGGEMETEIGWWYSAEQLYKIEEENENETA